MKTPAVTMVAAWIRAETGVGPSIASGSQVCSPICADLPMAPMNSRMHSVSIVLRCMPRNAIVVPTLPGTAAKTGSNITVLNTRKVPMMPSAKPKSPIRLTTNALMAAALAEGRSNQNPISR